MSGRHTQQPVWRPTRLGPVVAVAVALVAWAVAAVALLFAPGSTHADVEGTLAGAGTVVPDDGPPPALPPQTLRLAPTTAVDATPSDRRAGASRRALLAFAQAAADAGGSPVGSTAGASPAAEPVGGGGDVATDGPTTGGGGPSTTATGGPTDPATTTATTTSTSGSTGTTGTSTTTGPTDPATSTSTHTPPGQTRKPTHTPHTP